MITIVVKPNEDPKRALSRFKQALAKENLFNELKKRRYFIKPSLAKRLKREEAAKQKIKDIRKEIKTLERLEQQQWG